MNFSADFLPTAWLWMGHLLYASLLVWAIWKAPWYHLKNSQDAHVLLASCVILWLVWRNGAGVTPGMEFHLLLVTTVTLMFGWPFAILCVSLAQLGLTIGGQADWATYSLNTLCNGIIPVWIAYGIYWLTYIWLPRHFFIYIFITSFAGSALAMLASRLSGLGILLSSGTYSLTELGDEPLFIIVMLFPEAFTNGLLMTVLVTYRPQWVSSFSDKHYLYGK
jgi:uncharacterized membrane protein